jgi:putative transposase
MKDRQTRRLVAESIYVRNDGYRQADDTLVLQFKAGELWVGEQGRLELHYDRLRGKWYGHIPVKVKWPRNEASTPHQSTRKRASIDLGICNLATCVVEDSDRAMLRDLYDHLEAHGVAELIVGDLKHIRDNNDHGKVGNQKLHSFWPFMQIRQRIRELGEEYNIHVGFKSERGTSKRCSICGQAHRNGRIQRGLYKCAEIYTRLNADVNGAYNILYGRKVAAVSGSRPPAWPLLLKWNAENWQVSAA